MSNTKRTNPFGRTPADLRREESLRKKYIAARTKMETMLEKAATITDPVRRAEAEDKAAGFEISTVEPALSRLRCHRLFGHRNY